MPVNSHKDLGVWKKAKAFVVAIYSSIRNLPKEELYGLTSQIRRAAVSIPSLIAEGRAKRSTREYIRFVNMACGSAAEVETQLMISEDLGFLSAQTVEELLKELNSIIRMLNAMYNALEKKVRNEK